MEAPICRTCRSALSAEVERCGRCGDDPRPRCPRCSHRCPLDANFCPRCGARLRDPTEADRRRPFGELDGRERKLVTVLFADLVNSTSLADLLDAESYHLAITSLFRPIAAALRAHGAYVEKYVGDSVMAVFGAPTTREDDAERAIRASLTLHELAGGATPVDAGGSGISLRLRIGINSGLVIAGPVGEGRQSDYGVLGEVVNLAARLQAAAEPGQTVIGETTRALIGNTFACRSLPPLVVHGKARPVQAFVLHEPAEGPGLSGDGVVIRESELAELLDAARRLAGGERLTVAIAGEAGAGKTFLLDALRRRLGNGARWLSVACWGGPPDRPFAALGASLREHWLLSFRPTRRADVGGIASPLDTCRALAARVGLGSDPLSIAVLDEVCGFGAGLSEQLDRLEGGERRRMARDVVETVIEELLAAPTILVVDGAQWLEEECLDLLRDCFSLRDPPTPRGLLVAHRGPWPLSWEPDVRITLPPLSDDAAARLAESIPGLPMVRDEAMALGRLAGGNPRLVVELARAGRYQPLADDGPIPPSIQAPLLAALDRLPETARKVALAAAIIGSEVRREELRALVHGGDADLDRTLRILQERGILEPVVQLGRLRFRIPLLPRVAEASLLRDERRDLHRAFADWLEAHRPDEAERIAFHRSRL